MAAHIHDSVLQTLALIQRRADDPRTVVNLARRQERELRGWLFGTPNSHDGDTLATALETMTDEVEDLHRVTVEVVTVGDCPLSEPLDAMLAAAREALVNAAKWSRTDTISIYVEVEPSEVSLFVRDRGCGFDPSLVNGDHHGIAESIIGRMARYGGKAAVRSEPGNGTEVELTMARAAA